MFLIPSGILLDSNSSLEVVIHETLTLIFPLFWKIRTLPNVEFSGVIPPLRLIHSPLQTCTEHLPDTVLGTGRRQAQAARRLSHPLGGTGGMCRGLRILAPQGHCLPSLHPAAGGCSPREEEPRSPGANALADPGRHGLAAPSSAGCGGGQRQPCAEHCPPAPAPLSPGSHGDHARPAPTGLLCTLWRLSPSRLDPRLPGDAG